MTVTTICSGCMAEVTVDSGQAHAIKPSNGARGVHHRPATLVTSMTWVEDGVVFWDCPLCGHADSFDPDA